MTFDCVEIYAGNIGRRMVPNACLHPAQLPSGIAGWPEPGCTIASMTPVTQYPVATSSRPTAVTRADGAAAEAAGGTPAQTDPGTHVLGEQHAAAASGSSQLDASEPRQSAPAATGAAGSAAALPADLSAPQVTAAAAAGDEPARVPADAVPLVTEDGLLAIGGFDELLASPSQPQSAAPQGGDEWGPPPQSQAPSHEAAEEDLPNPPVSTEISRAEQDETAAAVADEMEHKDR